MQSNKISTKIKILGSALMISIFFVISVTIYLNQKNIKDASIVNIAGKQRMLTQKISKSVLYLYQTKKHDFSELDVAVNEFKFGVETLKNGSSLLSIAKAPTDEINAQIAKVELLWETFYQNIKVFKEANLNGDAKVMESSFSYIANSNNKLLDNVDMIVSLYTKHIEDKTTFIKYFQYFALGFIFLLISYAFLKLKTIEAHAQEFLDISKAMSSSEINEIKPLEVDGETEIVEAATNINCFIDKVNSAMSYSQSALDQSKMASDKLSELTNEFDEIITEMNDKTIISQLDKSEDIVIESSEELLKSTKKLQNLKEELDKLLVNCKS